MGAVLVEEGKIIGTCSLPICLCVEHNSKPQGCLNFRPHTTPPMEKSMGVYSQVTKIIEEWLTLNGLSFHVPVGVAMRIVDAASGRTGEESSTEKPKAAMMPASPEDVAPSRYCVIAVGSQAREWHPSVVGAARHAQSIFEKETTRYGRRATETKQLMIVKAHSIVEREAPAPPPVTLRSPRNKDFNRVAGATRDDGDHIDSE